MTDFKHKINTGSLFQNNNKKAENSPDWQGTFNIKDILFKVSGWNNKTKRDGTPYISCKINKIHKENEN